MKSRGAISEISFPPKLANARAAFPPEKIEKIVAPVGQSGKTAIDRCAGNPFGIGRVERDRQGVFFELNRKDAGGYDHYS